MQRVSEIPIGERQFREGDKFLNCRASNFPEGATFQCEIPEGAKFLQCPPDRYAAAN
jgi:hypothetical protein